MANYRYTTDLIEDVLFRAGEPVSGSEFQGKALQYLNRAYQSLWQGGQESAPAVNEDWLWLTAEGTLTLRPPVAVQVTTATGSQSLTFATPPTDDGGVPLSVASMHLQVDGWPDQFVIAAHAVNSTSATLDSEWTGPSGTWAGHCLPVRYRLPADFLRFVTPVQVRREGRVQAMSIVPLEALAMRRTGPWPTQASLVGGPTLLINTPPPVRMRAEYLYLRQPPELTGATGEEPWVPVKDRRVLADLAVGWILLDKNDSRADGILVMAHNAIRAMANENRAAMARMDRTIGRLIPRRDRLGWGMRSGYW